MKTSAPSRRTFLNRSVKLAMGSCMLTACPNLLFATFKADNDIPDPKKLNYCGYSCPDDCKLFIATKDNNVKQKKEAYTSWRIEEKYGLAFDPEQMVCYMCKTNKAMPGVVVERCSVRKCVLEKKYDCCIECDELRECNEELWKTFPDFHKSVIDMQIKYTDTLNNTNPA
jgi:hypothetical protein